MAEEAYKKSSLLGRGQRGYFLVFKKMFFKKVASSAMAEEAIKKVASSALRRDVGPARAFLYWETLESVSSCTRFSGFLTISSFGFNRLSLKLVGMFFGIVTTFIPKDFVPDDCNCFIAQICAKYGAHAHFGANLRDEAIPNKIL